MNVIYAKIWADLWHNKSRTIQIVLIVTFGAMGVGLTLGARNLTSAAVNADWVASAPPVMKILGRSAADRRRVDRAGEY